MNKFIRIGSLAPRRLLLELISVRRCKSQTRRIYNTLKRDLQGFKLKVAKRPAELLTLSVSRLTGRRLLK